MVVAIGDARVDVAAANVTKGSAGSPDARRLTRREDGPAQALVDEDAERAIVARGLGQPHRLGGATEAVAEFDETPAHLGAQIAIVAERQDGVVVALRHGVAVTALAGALAVGREDAPVHVAVMPLDP